MIAPPSFVSLFAELSIRSPQWIAPAIILGILLLGVVGWNHHQAGRGYGPLSLLRLLLKLMAICLLLVCLVEPTVRARRPKPRANLLPIVVDTSSSMEVALGRSNDSWRDRIDTAFQPDSPLMGSLSQMFQTRLYGFDSRLAMVDEVDQLRHSGLGSNLLNNLSELANRLVDQPVAGMLLMTDGNVDLKSQRLEAWRDFPVPLYAVIPSDRAAINDLKVDSVSVRQTNFETTPVTINAQITVAGALEGSAVARLIDTTDDSIVSTQPLELSAQQERYSVSFQFRPSDVGLRFYRLDVYRQSDAAAFDKIDELATATSSETTLINNTHWIAVDRRTGPYRVLYVAGRPNWDFKFLRRAIATDAEVSLTGLLRMAKKEPKFSFRDKAVSNSNRLFQGLGDEAEETAQQYDEPVMVAIGVQEDDDPISAFPKTQDALFKFDALILDDVEPEFFTQDQLDMIHRFVSKRGGGLMLLGGQEMFAGRKFLDSPLGDLSPVYPGPTTTPISFRNRYTLTREGMLQPWVRLQKTVAGEKERLRSMPAFTSVNPLSGIKPGAFPLATVSSDKGNSQVAVAYHRIGNGKVGANAIADQWRWSMSANQKDQEVPAQAWRQLVRWLVADVPSRAEVSASPAEDDSVQLSIQYLDRSFLPAESHEANVTITRPDGAQINLKADPAATAIGKFNLRLFDKAPGSYVANVSIVSPDGNTVAECETGWTRQLSSGEFQELGFNQTLLSKLVEQSGGQLVREDEIADLADQLDSSKVSVTELWETPLWHRGWVILLALGCFCGEWGIRRLQGLA
ncbi:hypothetical protein SV7mr_23850 [Stieleria bergensis]|uniref:Glutamine amidotransferase domain-containing protein n=1 Tax=Stieleria bergensis TaxID=2528025 RepID=A0A517SUR5_9BACT|nr:hypothetical protein SV7mr_23850 [Planctomycetes bacterium SV_7m_r]